MPKPPTHRPIHAATLVCSAAGLFALAAPAHAQFGGSVSLQSDNRFRGVSLSDGKPQMSLTASYDGAQGWYGGALLAPPPLGAATPGSLMQAYLGRVVGLGSGLDAEAGAITTRFSSTWDYNYSEAYAGLIGEGWNTRVYYSGNYFGRSQRSLYTELNANWALAPTLRGFAHVGALTAINSMDPNRHGPTRLDLRAGAAWRRSRFELQLAWVMVNRGGPYGGPYEHHPNTLVLGAMTAF